MKTNCLPESQIERKWLIVDAEGKVLGRFASGIAQLLHGKNKVGFSPHQDWGDNVIVLNAGKIVLTGNKSETKTYFRHSDYPKGAKYIPFKRMIENQPEKVIELAVKGMLPHNKLGRKMLKKLHVYCGQEHKHQAQNPVALEINV